MPKGLAHWRDFLSKKRAPVLRRTKKDVQALINQPHLSITQYADPIYFDVGFCAHIFREVNTQRFKAERNPLTTMDNALSHLGQGGFQQLLNKAPVFEELEISERNQQGYRRCMSLACHASLQATDWAVQRNVFDPSETQLSTLMFHIVEAMLWCYGGDAMPRIEHAYYIDGKEYQQASTDELGCSLHELGAALANAWKLPEMLADAFVFKYDNFTLATGVALAGELARSVSVNWYGKRPEQTIEYIAKYKGKAVAEIEHQLHLNAVELTSVLANRSYDIPARLIPLLADDNYRDQQFVFYAEAEQAADKKLESEANKVRGHGSVEMESKAASKIQSGQPGSLMNKKPLPEQKKTTANRSVQGKSSQEKPTLEKSTKDKPAQDKPKPQSALEIAKQQILSEALEKKKRQQEKQVQLEKQKAKPEVVTKAEAKQKPAVAKAKSADEIIKQKTAAKPAEAQKATPGEKSAQKAEVAKPVISAELAAAIKQFQLMVAEARPANDLIEHMVNACLLCGVQRCVFTIKLPNKPLLISRYSASNDPNEKIQALKIPLNKPHVFTLLMEKTRQIFLNDTNRSRYWNMIPESVKLATGVKVFFAMSVFANNHSMGLMYADKVKGELSQEEFAQFQSICKLLSKGIVQSAVNKKKAAS